MYYRNFDDIDDMKYATESRPTKKDKIMNKNCISARKYPGYVRVYLAGNQLTPCHLDWFLAWKT